MAFVLLIVLGIIAIIVLQIFHIPKKSIIPTVSHLYDGVLQEFQQYSPSGGIDSNSEGTMYARCAISAYSAEQACCR